MAGERQIPLWLLIAIETTLVFILGLLSNKLSSDINISTTALYIFSALGLLSLCFVVYIRHDPSKTNIQLSTLKQRITNAIQKIPLFQPDPLDKYRTEKELRDKAQATRSFIIGSVGGIVTTLFVFLVGTEGWKLVIWILISIIGMTITVSPMLEITSDDHERPKLWEILFIVFMFGSMLMIPGGLATIVILVIISWMFGFELSA